MLVAALGLSGIVLDTNIFTQYRFHLGAMTIVLFDTSTWVLTAVIVFVALGFQAMLAGNVWKMVTTRANRRGRLLALLLTGCWLTGTGIHIWADANAYVPVTSFTRYMPVYFPIKAKRTLAKLGLVGTVVVLFVPRFWRS